MEAKLYNQTGAVVKTFSLPEAVFGVKWNADAVHQVVTAMNTNARIPYAHTKNRGEVSGGGKKPWQQKGTGRARHGSTRSPIWVGGGIAHGPRSERLFDRKINRKLKAHALAMILTKKFKDGEILFVDTLSLSEGKTRAAKAVLESLAKVEGFERLLTKRANSAYLAVPKKEDILTRGFSNFRNMNLEEARNMNPAELLQWKYLVMVNPEEVCTFLLGKVSKKKAITQ